jgi:magnesium chelatase subunit I
VIGALDIEKALSSGEKAYEPGLLAKAHRGFLYIDEVNLLEDHLVDLLIDVAASGANVVEREGLSIRHPAKFVLVGSGNPEEGELRPQLLDRFGLAVEVKTPQESKSRVEIIKRRDEFERNPVKFMEVWEKEDEIIRQQIQAGKKKLPSVKVDDAMLEKVTQLCSHLGTDGLRGELTLLRAARAYAALCGKNHVTIEHLKKIAVPALQHRLRRNPLDDSSSAVRVRRALEELFPEKSK